jgi:hypothetical protein
MTEETCFPFENDRGQSWEFEMDFRDDGALMHDLASGWRGVFSDEYILLSSDIERPKGMSPEDFDAFCNQVMRDVVPHWRRWKQA